MDRFCIVINKDKDINGQVLKIITRFLQNKNKYYFVMNQIYDSEGQKYKINPEELPDNIECVIVLGGDGTILQTARDLVNSSVSIVGVNLGTVGFLAEIDKEQITHALELIIDNKYQIEQRMMIAGKIHKNGFETFSNLALNDIVIGRNGFSRIIQLKIYVNGELMDIYEADGIIVATPTGSTAYNLAAGGPILMPSSDIMAITPICPHSLVTRSIVVSGKDSITVEIGRVRKTQEIEAMATFDGQIGVALSAGDIVEITCAKQRTNIIRLEQNSFYKVLRKKIQ